VRRRAVVQDGQHGAELESHEERLGDQARSVEHQRQEDGAEPHGDKPDAPLPEPGGDRADEADGHRAERCLEHPARGPARGVDDLGDGVAPAEGDRPQRRAIRGEPAEPASLGAAAGARERWGPVGWEAAVGDPACQPVVVAVVVVGHVGRCRRHEREANREGEKKQRQDRATLHKMVVA
jgi:hypothetical protein